MSATHIRASSIANVMKFEGQNSINGFITQSVDREPFISIPIEYLLNQNGVSPKLAKGGVDVGQIRRMPEAVLACTQPASKGIGQSDKYHSAWPIVSTSPRGSSQLHKCSKCSKEFCSVVNYKRHIRGHRRSLTDKASSRSRELLGAFWDSLSLDAVKELVSLDNVTLDDVTGSSLFDELSWIGKLALFCIPQDYIKAGKSLLDLIQATSSIYPIQSHELFKVLDDASEKTFLCSGDATSLQKSLFDKETLRISCDPRNVIACISFLLEQKLVKAWLAEKDAEALKCQMLLVEEEEAAQRRQAALLEKRRLKKLKQKEYKTKETKTEDIRDLKEGSPDSPGGSSSSAETLTSTLSDLGSPSSDTKEIVIPSLTEGPETGISDVHPCVSDQCHRGGNISEETQESWHWESAMDESAQAAVVNAIHSSYSRQCNHNNVMKETEEHRGWKNDTAIQRPRNYPNRCNLPVLTKYGYSNKFSTASVCQKVWAQKTKNPTEPRANNVLVDAVKGTSERSEQSEKSIVLIGSMTVSLNDHDTDDARERLLEDLADKPCCITTTAIQSTSEAQKRIDNVDSLTFEGTELDHSLPLQSGVCSLTRSKKSTCSDEENTILTENLETSQQHEPPQFLLFSRKVVEDFLKRRWDEAVASEHLIINSSCDGQPVDRRDTLEGDCDQLFAADCLNGGNLGNFVKSKPKITTTGLVSNGVYKIKQTVNKEKILVR